MGNPAASTLRAVDSDASSPNLTAPPRPVRHTGLQGHAIVVLAVVAGVAALRAGEGFIIPILLALVTALALAPIVRATSRWIPRSVSSAVLVTAIVMVCGTAAYTLADDAAQAVSTLPRVSRQLRQVMRTATDSQQGHLFAQLQRAIAEVERTASESAQMPAPPPGVTPVQIVEPTLDLRSALWNGWRGLMGIGGQFIVVLFLTYFLLSFGDVFKRKLVRIAGPRLSERRVTLDAIDRIGGRVAQSLMHLAITGAIVGLATWLSLAMIGVRYAGLFGIAAGVLNAVPYLGPTLVGVVATLTALVQFGNLGMAAVVGAITLVITSVEGLVVTPLLFGRVAKVNPVAILVAALFFGWLWNGAGLLLSLPLLVMIKTVADTVDELSPLAELIGD